MPGTKIKMRILGTEMSGTNTQTPFSSLEDEELLRRVYNSRELLSSLELELAARLEHALNELADRPRVDMES